MPPSHHDLQPGTFLGRYEILAPIASGGMAQVWAARLQGSRGFSKIVAIKTMRPDVSDDVRFEQMFLDEAQIASRIRHGNVVAILDLGEQNQLLYLVMDYVDGEPLSVLRRAGGIPLRLGVRIIADAASGLHAAHGLRADDGSALGLVHRDVSPQNILISYEGAVKVTDFGIAKAAGRVSETTQRTLKGKPAFMSPEQLEGGVVDCRADVFALGIVAYQLICGLHPFRGENDLATVKNIVSKRPIQRPRQVNPAVDPKLEEVMLRALERDPEQRFQSAAELERALDELMLRTRRPRDDELAALMEQLLGDQGRARRKQLERAMSLADRRSAERASFPPPERPSGTQSNAATPLAYASAPRRRSSWLPIAVGALLLTGIVVAGLIGVHRLWRDRSAAAQVESAARTEPAPQPVAVPTPSSPIAAPSPAPDATASRPSPSRTQASSRRTTAAPPAPSAPAPSASAPPATPLKAPVPVMEPGF